VQRFLSCPLLLLVLAAAARAQDLPQPEPSAEVETLKPQLTLETGGHTAAVLMLFFSADGRQLVSVSEDHTVRFWDVETGELRRTLRITCWLNLAGGSQAGALSADRRTLVLDAGKASPDAARRLLTFLDLERGQVTRQVERDAVGGHVVSLDLSPDGRRLVTGNFEGAYVWDVADGRLLREIPRGQDEGVRRAAFSPDGKRLAVLMPPHLRVLDVATGRAEASCEVAGRHFGGVVWSPDGTTVALGTEAGVELWDARAGTRRKSFAVGYTSAMTWSENGRALLTAGALPGRKGARVNILDAASGQERRAYPLPELQAHVVAFSPDGKLVAATGEPDHVIHVWRRGSTELVWTAQGRGRPFFGAGWGKDGHTIAWGRTLNRAETDPAARQPLEHALNLTELRFVSGRTWTGFQRAVLSRDGVTLKPHQLAVVAGGRNVSLEGGRGDPFSGTLLPGNRAVLGTAFGHLYIVDTQTGKALRSLGSHRGAVHSMALSADSRYLLTASVDQTLRLWNVATAGDEKPLLTLFVAGRDWVAWAPGGYYTATPGGERLVGWTVTQGRGRLADFYPAERFRKQLYRPDLLKLVLEKGDVAAALGAARESAADVEQLLPPRATLEVLDKAALPKIKVKATAEAAAKGQPVTGLRLLVDGRPLPDGAGVLDLTAGQAKAEATWEVELPPGPHELKALARAPDTAGASAAVAVEVPVATAADRPTLHVISVGIDAYPQKAFQLKCAVSDARGLAEAFGRHCAGPDNLFGAAKVKPLLDSEATRAAVLGALKDVRQAVKPGDLLVFSFAGHGARQGKQFYLLTCDADPDRLAETALSGDDLRAALADLPCQVLLLLDACHSAAGVRAFIDEAARGLTDDETGVAVLCAAMGHEEAQERDGHGLFTRAVIEALGDGEGVPFDRHDRRLYVHHLGAFVQDEVKELSKDEQHPFLTLPYVTESFPVRQVPGK
jgi:WD40 repeat protein